MRPIHQVACQDGIRGKRGGVPEKQEKAIEADSPGGLSGRYSREKGREFLKSRKKRLRPIHQVACQDGIRGKRGGVPEFLHRLFWLRHNAKGYKNILMFFMHQQAVFV